MSAFLARNRELETFVCKGHNWASWSFGSGARTAAMRRAQQVAGRKSRTHNGMVADRKFRLLEQVRDSFWFGA
jgi:hypothetical protein